MRSLPGAQPTATEERQTLADTYGKKLGRKLDPRGFYDIFWTDYGPIAFRDNGTNPDSYHDWAKSLNENGLPFTRVRRGLCGWVFPKFITSLIAVDPDLAELRKLVASGPAETGFLPYSY